ncbi:uncharacterized protein TNCV_3683741 [Trichonephila clavipes]|nr:uncharacterized protein TNCV_3683741 [Trichonephila clavipes]
MLSNNSDMRMAVVLWENTSLNNVQNYNVTVRILRQTYVYRQDASNNHKSASAIIENCSSEHNSSTTPSSVFGFLFPSVYYKLYENFAKEDFGKRNMPGKRARRHFSQLSEFERGLINGMKTAGWSTRLVAGQVDRSECAVRNCWEQWTREGIHAPKTGSGATRKTTRREDRRIVRQALVDPTVTH